MAIIINYDLPDNITVNILPTGETVVNVLPKSPIVVNLCNDNGQSTTDYAALTGKPKINDIELVGNKTLVQLGIEPKRGADDFYVTGAEKTQGALATGMANPSPISGKDLSTVKKLAQEFDKTNRLLVDFTVPTDTSSITFDRDKNGVLFSDLNIKGVIILTVGETITTSSTIRGILINDVISGYYQNVTTLRTACGFHIAKYFSSYYTISIAGLNLIYNNLVSYSNDLINFSAATYTGHNNTNQFNSIDNIKFNLVNLIKSGSVIKIYRND